MTRLKTEDLTLSLIKKAQGGDKQAMETLLHNYKACVAKIAHKYTRSGCPFDDLMQEGSIGLVKAIDRFDPEFGAKFITYATYWVRQEIHTAATRQPFHIRIPNATLKKRTQIQRARREFHKEHGRFPEIEELVLLCKMAEEVIQDLLSLQTVPISTDEYVEGTDLRVIDTIKASDPLNEEELAQQEYIQSIRDAVNFLPEGQRIVIIGRFNLDDKGAKSHRELAEVLNLSAEGVRNREISALKRLRVILGKNHAQTN